MNDNLAYQKETWEELLGGKLVAMSPRPAVNHNRVMGNIYRAFANRLHGRPCEAFSDGVDVSLTPTDRVIPDAMVVCNRDIIKPDGIHGPPDLVVEVLSPSTKKRDRTYKKDLYERCGVREYWLAEPDTKTVEVYLLQDGKYILDEVYQILPDYMEAKLTEEERTQYKTQVPVSLYPDFSVPLDEIFHNIS